jgi:hypothetical protein
MSESQDVYPLVCDELNICDDNDKKTDLNRCINKYTKNSSMFNKGLIAFMYNYYKDELPEKVNIVSNEFIEKKLVLVKNSYALTIRDTCILFMEAYNKLALAKQNLEKIKNLEYIYHGGNLSNGNKHKAGDSVRVLGFLSTAFQESTANTFLGPRTQYLYKIKVSEKCFPMCLASCSTFPDEEEFLLPIGTQLVINRITSTGKQTKVDLRKSIKYETFIIECTAIAPTSFDVNTLISMFRNSSSQSNASGGHIAVIKPKKTTNIQIISKQQYKTASEQDATVTATVTVDEKEFMTVSEQDYMTVSEENYKLLLEHISKKNSSHACVNSDSDLHIFILNRNRKILQYVKYKNELITLAKAKKLDRAREKDIKQKHNVKK